MTPDNPTNEARTKPNTKTALWVLLALSLAIVGCGLASPKPASTPTPLPPPVAAGFTIDFIDVGQGDATLITAVTSETLLVASGLPPDSTRMSKELFGLASRLAARGIAVERMPRGRQRGIRLYRR